jgi:putative resolvase
VRFRRLPSGTIPVDVTAGDERVVLYARVSSCDQRADLDRQVARLTKWATAAGMEVGLEVPHVCEGVVAGVGSKR